MKNLTQRNRGAEGNDPMMNVLHVPPVPDVPSVDDETRPSTTPHAPWPRVKLGLLGTMERGCGIKRCETISHGRPCLRYGEIYTSYEFVLNEPRSFVSQEVFDNSLHIKKGDLVFTLTGETELEIAKTLAYLGNEEIAAGGDLAVWSGHGCDPKYLAYLMYTPELIKAKALASNGQIIVHISVKKIQEIEIPLPPLPVQRSIVARLERELGVVEKVTKAFEELERAAEGEFKAELKETFESLSEEKLQLASLEDDDRITLGRGKIISRDDIANCVGDYPVYSSSATGNGEIGRYGKYMFDDERITWSIDGGGRLFYRHGHRYSVTNVCGWLRVNDPTICSDYLYYALTDAWSKIEFNYTHKAHPSVIRKEYFVAIPNVQIQREIVARLDAARERKERLVSAAKRGREAAALWRKAILKEAFE